MTALLDDPRLRDPRLDPPHPADAMPGTPPRAKVLLLFVADVAAAVWYFGWLLQPGRVGNPVLYGVLLVAELFNLVQAVGFWWTVSADRRRPAVRPPRQARVDVLIPRYDEPVHIVEPVVRAAALMHGADVRVLLLDDGDSPDMADLAARHGVTYVRRERHTGAKAGNLNHALRLSDAPYVAVFDCDHVPDPDFLVATLGHLADARVAFVQTPQYYANASHSRVAAAAWSQQALFFGCIARGKDGLGAMLCCGTNVVFRRAALDEVGGFPEDSVTEDFELSVRLQERGWRSAYVPEVLARGLGPEDLPAYAGQQLRWARGCLSAIPATARARLPWRLRTQYLLSSAYFLSGWTVLVYMSLPPVRILTGAQPIAVHSADLFLVHFAPYFVLALLTVAVAGAGRYTFAAYALAFSCFWVHVAASARALLRLPGGFVVTPKAGPGRLPLRAASPALCAVAVLGAASLAGLVRSRDAAMLNNVAFASLHMCVLMTGIGAALWPRSVHLDGAGAPIPGSARPVRFVVAQPATAGRVAVTPAGAAPTRGWTRPAGAVRVRRRSSTGRS
jgi:cellulose synthase (UDP-forming)